MDSVPVSRAVIPAAVFWLLGWAGAVAYGHGSEFVRMVVAIPGIVIGSLVLIPGLRKGADIWLPGVAVAGVAGIYFAVRALSSPVWDLGRSDLLLVCLCLLSIVAGIGFARDDRAIRTILGGFILLFLVNVGVGVVQATHDQTYAFLRMPRVNKEGVSGLFWHRNYLAGMLELILPVFLAGVLVSRRKAVRGGFLVLTLAGLALGYFTQSRAGFASIGIGGAATIFCWLFRGWQGWSRNARIGLACAGGLATILLLVLTLAIVSKVSGERGKDGSLEAAMATTDVRLPFAGSAYEQWQERPLVGTGARSFSYLVVRNWDRKRTWNGMGNPEMAHNDYLQTLAEYGLIGFLLVVTLSIAALGRGVNQMWTRESGSPGLLEMMQLGAVGSLVGAMVHSTVDFSLHILPNTLLLGLMVGFLWRGRSRGPDKGTGESGDETRSPLAGVLLGVLAVLAAAGSLIAGGRELLTVPKWFGFEQGAIESGVTESRKNALKEIITEAPSHELARLYGRVVLDEMYQRPDDRERLAPDARWAMELAVERHPFDGESWLNLGRIREVGKDDAGACRAYLRGIEATWRREDKYGGMNAFSDHLARRAEESFLARKPAEALGFYRRAKEYLEASWALNYRPGGGPEYRQKTKFLEGRISFLEGAGITASDLGGEVPPPPEL